LEGACTEGFGHVEAQAAEERQRPERGLQRLGKERSEKIAERLPPRGPAGEPQFRRAGSTGHSASQPARPVQPALRTSSC